MNEFWWGVLALPIIALAVAAGAAAIFGSWLLFERWATDRLKKLPPVHVSQKLGDGKGFPLRSATQLGGRGIFAALFLSVDKVWFLRLGPNTGISIVHGKGNQQYDTKFMHRALQKAIDDIAVAEQEAEAAE